MDYQTRKEYEAAQPRLPEETQFAFKIRIAREWEAIEKAREQDMLKRFAAHVPDIDLSTSVSPEQKALDDFIQMIKIDEAYNRWAGKGLVAPGNRTESIKVRCPNPGHPDKNPSAWLNTEKNLFNCAKCGGGDLWDIAAWHFGFSVPGYKHDASTFRLLREKIGESFGMVVEKGIAGDTYLVKTETPPVLPIEPTPTPVAPQQPMVTDNVTYTTEGAEHAEIQEAEEHNKGRQHPNIDWRTIVPEDTFLRAYLEETCRDDAPEEYHFWNGLVAVGLAAGGMRTLEDVPEVHGNLFVCTVGPSGTGKSKANRHLVRVLLQALPYERDDQPPYGAQYIRGGQSGEVIIKSFQHPMIDPSGKQIGFWPFVKGCIHFDELADMIGKSSRLGSTLKTTLMELYDNPVHLRSTSMTHGTVNAERPFGSAITTTQFRSMRDLISKGDDGSGFVNRWVFATGVPKRQESINRTRIDLAPAISKLAGIAATARAHSLVKWTPEAEKLWDEFFHVTYIPLRYKNPDSSILQRLDLLMKKLFLLFAVNEKTDAVSEDQVRRALTIFPYLVETYGYIEGQISATEEGDLTDLILRQIQRMTGSHGPTARDLHQVIKRKVPSVGRLRKILENLVILGVIQEAKMPPGPNGGRPTSCYIVTPGVDVAS